MRTAVIHPLLIVRRMSAQTTAHHEMLAPLAWLFGKWRSQEGEQGGKGQYPTIKDFVYSEEAEFSPIGMKPIVEYKMCSWHPDTKVPMHRESGYIRIKPQTNHIAFVTAHNMGVVEIQEGQVSAQSLKLSRVLSRKGNQLEQVVEMKTEKTDLTEHLRITFHRVQEES